MKLKYCMLICITCICQITLHSQNFIKLSTNATAEEVLETAVNVRPTERQLTWQSMEYYAFIHFGPNTFLGQEWGDGTASPSVFNPTALDANQWAKTIRDAGMKGLILTAKHHDGFCLWPTKTTEYSVKNSPWRNGQGDLVREVATACQKVGIKMGIYLSPWDRNNAAYGDSPAYNKLFMAQLTELLTNYGDIFEVWFDGANGEGPNGKVQQYDFESYYELIRKLQPNAVIAIMGPDVRWCGNEAGKGRDPEWSVLPITSTSQKQISDNSQQQAGTGMFIPKNAKGSDLGSREKLLNSPALIWYPSEVDTSIRPGWFYHSEQDDKVKSADKLEEIYYNSIGMNASFLLNIPPDKRGLIHENDIKVLREFRDKIDNTFRENLFIKASIHVNSVSKNFKSVFITDNDDKTFWKAKFDDISPMIECKFKKSQKFDRILLKENIRNGQFVEKFVVEAFSGNKWIQVAEGKTIGYKRIIRFSPIESKKIRIRFIQFRSAPEISEIGLYLKSSSL